MLKQIIKRENKMAYKIVKEWKSKDGSRHEITVYKYNYTKDEMIRYWKVNGKVSVNFYSVRHRQEELYGEGN